MEGGKGRRGRVGMGRGDGLRYLRRGRREGEVRRGGGALAGEMAPEVVGPVVVLGVFFLPFPK